MKNTEDIGKYLRNILKTAKRLGLVIMPGGGYASSYHNINNLPQYEVGLLGAISVIEGIGARDILQKRFDLTFNETMELEAGFNGVRKPKKANKKGQIPSMTVLETVGAEVGKTYGGYSYGMKYTLKGSDSLSPTASPSVSGGYWQGATHDVPMPEYDAPAAPTMTVMPATEIVVSAPVTTVVGEDIEAPIQAVAPNSPELQMEGHVVAANPMSGEAPDDEEVMSSPSISPSADEAMDEAVNEYITSPTTHGAFQALLNTLASTNTPPAQELNALFDAAEAEIDTALDNLEAQEENSHEHSHSI